MTRSISLLLLSLSAVALGCATTSEDPATEGQEAALTSPQCLQNASNEALLTEISTRLLVPGGNPGGATGGATPTASGHYVCAGAVLSFGILGPSGEERRERIDLTFASTCADVARDLMETKSNITTVVGIGVCTGGVLHRFTATPQGDLNRLDPIDFTFASTCATEAARFNRTAPVSQPSPDCLRQASNGQLADTLSRRLSGNAPPPTLTAQATFLCRGGRLDIGVITPDGRETREEVDLTFGSTCTDAARLLTERRQTLTQMKTFGVCATGVLHRFSAGPQFGLRRLESIDFTFASTCTEQAAAINR